MSMNDATVFRDTLMGAYEKARDDLLGERNSQGHWVGELATSALSTATAVSALSLVDRDQGTNTHAEMIERGVTWLIEQQNEDGGWGDTDKSFSNISTAMLARAAIHLAGKADQHAAALESAERYIEQRGGIPGLKERYGIDRTFSVPILTNCALAGLVDWREVSPLPFELAAAPQSLYRFLRMPVVSYAIPALVAIGQARYFHRKPWNPISRLIRAATVAPSLRVLDQMQPASGGYLEAIPLTSFVVMSLAGTGRSDHTVAVNGVRFILESVRPDGSWPIDTNLATWNTSLSINALASAGEDVSQLECWRWLLDCQYKVRHPFTGAAPGGWGWSNLSGAVPDADDTPGALLAIAALRDSSNNAGIESQSLKEAARNGVTWLLDLQNNDYGWPTFCKGWGRLPFDRSGSDLTAHVLRALHAWRHELTDDEKLTRRIERATKTGIEYLTQNQGTSGYWLPLWFGNQHHAYEENPIYGTSKVLLAYRDLGKAETDAAKRGFSWLAGAQNKDGGWGGGPGENGSVESSVEETSLALHSLLAAPEGQYDAICQRGAEWLVRAVADERHRECAPIGFYFAKLWYYERLYPLIFAVEALGGAVGAKGQRAPHPNESHTT